MGTTFECKWDQSGAIFSSYFNLRKHESVCQYEQGCEFGLGDAYLIFLFREVDGPKKPLPVDEHVTHTNNDLRLNKIVSMMLLITLQRMMHRRERTAFFQHRQFPNWICSWYHSACEQRNFKTFDSRSAYISSCINSPYKRLRNWTFVIVQVQKHLRQKHTQQSWKFESNFFVFIVSVSVWTRKYPSFY